MRLVDDSCGAEAVEVSRRACSYNNRYGVRTDKLHPIHDITCVACHDKRLQSSMVDVSIQFAELDRRCRGTITWASGLRIATSYMAVGIRNSSDNVDCIDSGKARDEQVVRRRHVAPHHVVQVPGEPWASDM